MTVEESLTVIASGELVECTTNNELKTYRFYLSTPAPAPFIGLAIGYFFFNTIKSMNYFFFKSQIIRISCGFKYSGNNQLLSSRFINTLNQYHKFRSRSNQNQLFYFHKILFFFSLAT